MGSAKSTSTGELGICYDLAQEIEFFFFQKRNGFPETWDDFISVKNIKNKSESGAEFRKLTMNSFSLVPGHPVVKDGSEIPRSFVGDRLILVSRSRKYNSSLNKDGRYSIFAELVTQEPETYTAVVHFLPETVALAILAQIPDFDPIVQPLAFEDSKQLEMGQKEENKKTTQVIEQHDRDAKIKIHNKNGLESPYDALGVKKWSGNIWLVVITITFIFLMAILVKLRKKS